MNKQKAPRGIEWTRIKTEDGVLDGYTWNPVGGCKHGCEWDMPDGSKAVCYAKTIAERVALGAYPHGFEHHYWNAERLNEPLKAKKSAGIFMDSMSDLMGHWVDEKQIRRVLDVCKSADWHVFQMLTKNAPRLLKFVFPENVWVGVSSPPDVMFGKRLSRGQQAQMLKRSLDVLQQVNVPVRWMSFEPLSWDVSTVVANSPNVLNWAVIGAASNGRNEYPPRS
jgi:protein gp37